MEWAADFEKNWIIFRFAGGMQAVGPLEMEPDGRIMFRVAVPATDDVFAYIQTWLDLPPGDAAEGIRKIYAQGLAVMPEATFAVSERLRWS